MNATQNPNTPPITFSGTKTPVRGITKAKHGTNHPMRGTDGVVTMVPVRDRSRYPHAKVRHICLNAICMAAGRKWTSLESLIAEHPEQKIMARQEETHVVAMWSDDPLVAVAPKAKGDKDAPEPPPGEPIGLLSDEGF